MCCFEFKIWGKMTCDMTYIFVGDAVGNVVSGFLKGAVVA